MLIEDGVVNILCYIYVRVVFNPKVLVMNTVVYSTYYKKDKSRLMEEEQFHLEGLEREIRYNRLTTGRREETCSDGGNGGEVGDKN